MDEGDVVDLGACPYYRKQRRLPGGDVEGEHGPGTCAFGCYAEPDCIASEPLEGWPSAVAALAAMNDRGDDG